MASCSTLRTEVQAGWFRACKYCFGVFDVCSCRNSYFMLKICIFSTAACSLVLRERSWAKGGRGDAARSVAGRTDAWFHGERNHLLIGAASFIPPATIGGICLSRKWAYHTEKVIYLLFLGVVFAVRARDLLFFSKHLWWNVSKHPQMETIGTAIAWLGAQAWWGEMLSFVSPLHLCWCRAMSRTTCTLWCHVEPHRAAMRRLGCGSAKQ